MVAPSLLVRRLSVATAVAIACAFTVSLTAQIPTRNVNMVSGLVWPTGDPFLQRQNEPSMAASTRNPLHLLAGSNDYRSVDLPIVLSDVDGEVGDAWLGLYKSTDGGERWTSTLLPGHPHDRTLEGQTSPLRGYHAAADPVVRAGTSGLMYYAGLAFDRAATDGPPGKSAIFVARFIDNNNQEAGDPFRYLATTLVTTSPGGTTGVFLDKPWLAVDIPRQGGGTCTITSSNEHGAFTQRVPAGNVYVAFTVKSVDAQGDRWDLYLSRSVDCGARFSAPVRVSRPEDRVNQGATIVIAPNTGEVFVAWRRIDLAPDGVEEHAIVVSRSTDQGNKWNPPGVARRFPRGKKLGLDPAHFAGKGKKKNAVVAQTDAAELSPFDQGTSAPDQSFRTNAYPTLSADATGRLYLAWTERGFSTHADPARRDPFTGDARIVLSTSTTGSTWSPPTVVSEYQQLGHQIMPALSFAGGKLMLVYYDLQEDRSTVFAKYVDDKTAFAERIARGDPPRRHTIDIRVSMANPGESPVFEPSRSVSSYMHGARTATGPREQLQVNAPNLPMFRLGTVPFIGDYIDIAPTPAFVRNATGAWVYNTAATSTAPVFHVAWTDNRDVKPPPLLMNGARDWQKYTPPTYTGERPDPGAEVILCDAGYAGHRNQNIYTARVTGGLIVGSPQNSKQLNTQFARAFVVFARNTTDQLAPRVFRMTILNQPAGGRASFSQFPAPPFTPGSAPPLTSIDVTIPRFTTASRTVYVTSIDPRAPVTVDVSEIATVGAPAEIPGGLEGTIQLNLDVDNPEVDNPEVDNPEVDNPEVDNAEVYNPEVDNPEVDNPEVDNPEVDNPEVDNPEVDNIVVGNPEVDNPEVDNPEVDNPEVDNPEVDNPEVDNTAIVENGGVITDVTWKIRNIGNTTTAYNVNVFLRRNSLPSTGTAQLLIYRIYKTPVIRFASCDVQTVTQNIMVANIPSPRLVLNNGQPSEPNDSDPDHATLAIEPLGEVRVTLRISDPIAADNIVVGGASIDPEWVPERDVFLIMQPQSADTNLIPPDGSEIEPPLVGADPRPVFTVTTTADSGAGSLREAMTMANAQSGVDTIAFNIPGAGPHTITPLTLLPNQTEAVVIDGSTQPGYAGTPVIEIDGDAIVGLGGGIKLIGGGSTVRGLAINRFGDEGIKIEGPGGNGIFGNYIGVDLTGTASRGNGNGGISLSSSSNNVIGGLAPLDRNVISANSFFGILLNDSTGNRIEGNYVGTDATGSAALPQFFGIALFGGSSSNIIGGNTISGNLLEGVTISAGFNRLEKNRIGLNAAGLAALPNQRGVRIDDGVFNEVIDNVISGNTTDGILITRGAGDPTNTRVTSNKIGTNEAGAAAVPNQIGVRLEGVSNMLIGDVLGGANVISGNSQDGIYIGPLGATPAMNNIIRSNLIGLDAAGLAPIGNGFAGVSIVNSHQTIVGGQQAIHGNVISGNAGGGVLINGDATADNNLVLANHIGFNVAGGLVGNTGHGVRVVASPGGTLTGNQIGGGGVGEGNVIGGNTFSGVAVIGNAVNTRINQNYIGVAADGITDAGNGQHGITVSGGASSTGIGGLGRNVISGNAGYGVIADAAPGTSVGNNYIGAGADGNTAIPNGAGGVLITGGTSTAWVIGGSAGAGNVISGNSGRGIEVNGVPAGHISFNFIGLNAAGNAAMPNGLHGIDADTAGATVIDSNVVSANPLDGIHVEASPGITITRNIVGLDAAGDLAFGNAQAGIRVVSTANAVIGGSGAGNAVSANGFGGIRVESTPNVQIRGNIAGLDAGGTVSRGNSIGGIVVIGATTSGSIGGDSAATRNVVSGNTFVPGIFVDDATNLFVEGNYIGLNATGTAAVANLFGVAIGGGTNIGIGGSLPGRFNVISGNEIGVHAQGGSGNRIDSNLIGTDPTGLTPIPNTSHGVRLQGGTANYIVSSTIAFNGGDGVRVLSPGSGHVIRGSIHSNAGLGIDLGGDGVSANDPQDPDGGANSTQNYPVITTAMSSLVIGTLNSTPNTFFNVVAFASTACDPSGFGEGEIQVGQTFILTNGSGDAVWSIGGLSLSAGSFVTALATSVPFPGGNSSEFSACMVVTPDGPLNLVVTNTNDSGPGSLRTALQLANTNPGAVNNVSFNIPPAGTQTITPASALPMITAPVNLDASTQPGWAGTPIIELDGSSTLSVPGLEFRGNNSLLRGFVINRFTAPGVRVTNTTGFVAENNYVGTDVTGTIDLGNEGPGIELTNVSNSTIGGTDPDTMNLLSGNGAPGTFGVGLSISGGSGHLVIGNRIGTNAGGTAAVPNENQGINLDASGSRVGGSTAAERNIISGNGSDASVALGSYAMGVSLFGTGTNNRIVGNYIGVDISGTVAIRNTGSGVGISGTTGHFVGGTNAGEGNVISGNGAGPAFGRGIDMVGANANTIYGNFIGTDPTGAVGVPNLNGGVFVMFSNNNVIGGANPGEANVIAFNSAFGVGIQAGVGTGTGNTVSTNSIHSNTGLDMDLIPAPPGFVTGVTPNDAGDADGGANLQQNFPVLTGANLVGALTSVSGTLNSTPNSTFDVRLFASPSCNPSGFGGGLSQRHIFSMATDGAGDLSFNIDVTGAPLGWFITATATDAAGNTSEFSQCRQVVAP